MIIRYNLPLFIAPKLKATDLGHWSSLILVGRGFQQLIERWLPHVTLYANRLSVFMEDNAPNLLYHIQTFLFYRNYRNQPDKQGK